MSKKYIKKENVSFRDFWFRIPGLIISIIAAIGDFTLRLKGSSNSDVSIDGKSIPAFLALSLIGLLMFSAPYLELGWNLWMKSKAKKNGVQE